jgi:signal transduction histidine kinase
MIKNDKLLTNLLRLEVAKKGQAATFAFLGFAFFSFIYGFGCTRFLLPIKIISTFLFVVSIARFFLYKKIISQTFVSEKEWLLTVILITVNGFGYGLILWLVSYELKLSGTHFVVTTTFIAGLVGSSIVTLAYFPILFIPFQAFLLLPQVGTILYFYFSDEKINFLPLIILYLMYFVYQIKQFRSYRKDLVRLFSYQIELEAKNQELSESKNVIIDQTVKLVQASRLAVIGEMSAGVAHEINNPLTIISSCAQMINRFSKAGTIDSEALVKHSEKIHKSIERISSIVKGLKYFANQTTDRIPKKNYTIQRIMDDTTPFFLEHMKSLDISLRVQDIPEIEICCHPVQISQVLINLLKNAADALPEELPAHEKWVAVNFKIDERFFYFMISNGGEKIKESVTEKIFSPFYTTKDTGTGLGLSISQTIMKDHEGDLYLDFNNNEKTTFVMKHPRVFYEY